MLETAKKLSRSTAQRKKYNIRIGTSRIGLIFCHFLCTLNMREGVERRTAKQFHTHNGIYAC